MNNRFEDFYVRLEDKFRGSRSDIKSRLAIYLEVLSALPSVCRGSRILDIGCGRGEWLELLSEHGWQAYGRDLNAVMVSRCQSLGLDVACEDALEHLRGLPDSSLCAVTGFHIVEHLPFEFLLQLFSESFRVLMPGGVAIFETPNPENAQVGSHTFYLDPTHIRPLPPSLLAFVAEDAGFKGINLLRLHPYPEYGVARIGAAPGVENLSAQVLFGAQDYAVIASKGGDPSQPAIDQVGAVIEKIYRSETSAVLNVGLDLKAQGEQIQELTRVLKESEADRTARGEQIASLSAMLQESEADRTARGEQIAALSAMLQESEADRTARGEQIAALSAMLQESEADRVTLVADLCALFSRPAFRLLVRFLSWREVKNLAERIGMLGLKL